MITSRIRTEIVSPRIYMAHSAIRWLACLLCSLVAINAGYANAQNVSEWENVMTGTTHLSNVLSVQYTVGYSSIGYDHFRSEIVLNWHDGVNRAQTIYEGIYDNPPAKIWGIRDDLCVSMETCVRYEDNCKKQFITYRYDNVAKSFSELDGDGGMCR